MSRLTTDPPSAGTLLTDALRAPADRQTYRNLLYMLLAFPLGLLYFVLATLGFVLGLGLSIVGIGIVILLGTVIGLRGIAAFERGLANSLLGANISAPEDVESDAPGFVNTVKAYLGAASTWRGLGFVLLKFWLGVLSFILLVTLLGTAIELVLLPTVPGGALNVEVFNVVVADQFETQAHRLLAVPIGIFLAFVALPILNAFAKVNASIASGLLGPGAADTDT